MNNKTNPFLAKITERSALCGAGSFKNTMHIVLDLTGSEISYSVGDCVAIFPTNDAEEVNQFLDALQATGKEIVLNKRTGESYSFKQYLTEKCNIHDCPPKFLQEFKIRTGVEEGLNHPPFQLLKGFNKVFSLQEICDLLKPMLPRFYSIASSMKKVGNEVHLTVALEAWQAEGEKRVGVCTDFLCRRAPLNQANVPLYLQPHKGFTIPADPNASIIMIGPGTGVAPFRAFMQERELSKDNGKNWLFFGECHQEKHFFYQEYWKDLEERGLLKLVTAFSRDQEYKIYVQDRMKEHAGELFEWLEAGAFLYVCGDASRMAKDVDATLHQIVEQYGKDPKDYMKRLRSDKRYLRDVY